jgi:anti-sigma regulatory factor (Ser/Thr protein kinase)
MNKENNVCRSLTLQNEVDQLSQLAPFVWAFAEEAQLDEQPAMQLDLALDEAVTNVVLYAYPKGTEGEVTVAAKREGDTLEVVLTDSGTPFDPTAQEDPDLTLSADERPIGGLGIFLVRQMMDTVLYERKDGKNILTLRKNLASNR